MLARKSVSVNEFLIFWGLRLIQLPTQPSWSDCAKFSETAARRGVNAWVPIWPQQSIQYALFQFGDSVIPGKSIGGALKSSPLVFQIGA